MPELDPVFSAALRSALVARVERSARVRRRRPWRLGLWVLAGSALAAGGTALATHVLPVGGGPYDTPLAGTVSVARSGTATIELGPRPPGATDVSLRFVCLSAGTFFFGRGGASATCHAADLRRATSYRTVLYVMALRPGQHRLTVSTGSEARWRLQARYVNQVLTPWGRNHEGQTYGVPNAKGTPDLVAVEIDAGHVQGYVRRGDLACASGQAVHDPKEALAWDRFSANRGIAIPVYRRNGTAVIGTFIVGDRASGATITPLASLAPDCLSLRVAGGRAQHHAPVGPSGGPERAFPTGRATP